MTEIGLCNLIPIFMPSENHKYFISMPITNRL